MEKYGTLITEVDQEVLLIKINRPEQLNALNAMTLDDLESAVKEANSSKEIKCIILTGVGEKAFVAGADIKEFTALNADNSKAFAERGTNTYERDEKKKEKIF